MQPKILIGIGTCDKFSYVEKHCFDSIRKQTYKNFDVFILDNSVKKSHYFDLIVQNPDFKVAHINRAKYFRDALAQVRKHIVDYAVVNDYDYLLFIDVDHILQSDTLKKLISHKKDFITGAIGYLHKNSSTVFKKGTGKGYTWKELDGKGLFEIKSSGLACALIDTKFLIGINFYISHSTMSFREDTTFCHDIAKKGAKLYCDSSVKPLHLHIQMPERMERRNATFKGIKLPN